MQFPRLAVLLCAFAACAASAQQGTSFITQSRDAASVYVSTGNLVVARLARECLALVGRSEPPQQFVTDWQQRNARFVAASAKYLDKRVEDAAASGGPDRRNAILRELRVAVQGGAESEVRSLLESSRKEEACMRAVTLLDAHALDISPKARMYPELEALVRWAEQ
jgi:hypothetical protein